MRILYLYPGPLSATAGGADELRRREELLRTWAAPDTTVDVRDTAAPDGTATGPVSFETSYEGYLALPGAVAALDRAEADGYDAAILGCFGDPALEAVRERMDRLPVVGPGAASCHLAAQLGEAFGIVTTSALFMTPARRLVAQLGLAARCVDIALVDQAPRDMGDDTADRVRDAAERLRDAGADTLVLGCLTLGFLGVAERLTADLDLPVVNPARASLATAETLVRCGLLPSPVAYPTPHGTILTA